MYKNLRKYKKQLTKEGKVDKAERFNFYPQTYYMPNEYTLFMDEYRKNLNSFWIMKPVSSAQGRGIFFVTNPQQIAAWKNSLKGCQENILNELFIAQKYVMNPLLIGGKKFDLRVYALVTNFNPLTIYVYRCGFARFTHARYSNDLNDLDNQFIHLTNVAIQKNCDNYDKTTGGKWNLRNLRIYLYSRYSKKKVDYMFDAVEDVIVHSIESVSKIIVNDKHCFELYGFDILIDDQLNPVLIEINSNPSLSANTKQDNDMKVGMLDDMLTIIDIEKVLVGEETQIGGFDLIYKGSPIRKDESLTKRSNLGCFNDRDTQLKKLAKKTANKLMHINTLKKSSLAMNKDSKIQRVSNSARRKKIN